MDDDATVLFQGAEAIIYEIKLFSNTVIVKHRFPKTYRHKELDGKLSRERTLQEARSLVKVRSLGIPCPAVYWVDLVKFCIAMEKIENSIMLKEMFYQESPADKIQLAEIISKLHNANVIHGDLTSSNLLVDDCGKFYIIDFGLSFISNSFEDKAVDLYVLERAFISTHPHQIDWFHEMLEIYFSKVDQSKDIYQKLAQVRHRGRKRDMTG